MLQIEVKLGPAMDTLQTMLDTGQADSLDFAFIGKACDSAHVAGVLCLWLSLRQEAAWDLHPRTCAYMHIHKVSCVSDTYVHAHALSGERERRTCIQAHA